MKNPPPEFAHIGGLRLQDCIDEGLDEVRQLLASCTEAADARAFRRQAESYARTVSGWKAFKPTDEQLHAMLECISAMLTTMRAYVPNESGIYAAVTTETFESAKNR